MKGYVLTVERTIPAAPDVIFDVLADGPMTVVAVSQRLSLPEESTARLLAAAAALRLVEARGQDRYGLGMLGAALRANPSIAALVEHDALLYEDLKDPLALLRGERRDTALGHYWGYAHAANPASLSAEQVAPYTALMAQSQALITDEILDAYPLRDHRCLLDVGGGNGAFAAAAASRAPDLRIIVFDLPAVAARAKDRFFARGLADRADAIGGDFLTDPLPQGADVVSLVRVLHDHDDSSALAILRAARLALARGGTLLIAEPMAGAPGGEIVGDAYFGFYLLAMGRGRPRTRQEIVRLASAAGFSNIRPAGKGLLVQILAFKAGPTNHC